RLSNGYSFTCNRCLVDSRAAIYDYTIHRNLFTRPYNHDIPNSNIIDINHYFLPITSNERSLRGDTQKRTHRISRPIHAESFKLFTDSKENDNKSNFTPFTNNGSTYNSYCHKGSHVKFKA